MRPKHHLNTLSWQDALDSSWAGLWLAFTYQGMYGRGMVDDKTRLLCMVGNCVAVGEGHEGRAHMKGALRKGAKPREILEVILQSCTNFGMPTMLKALKAFVTKDRACCNNPMLGQIMDDADELISGTLYRLTLK